MRRQISQVQEFHETFGVHVGDHPTAGISPELATMRATLIQEELNEYKAACDAGDIVEIADALSDLLYVVFGTVVTHGLQDVAVELFDEVHRSNMSKLDENGEPIYREDGKVLKSHLFSQPDLVTILSGGE